MAANENIQKINAALSVFSVSTDKGQIQEANDWLQDFQHTVSGSRLAVAY